MQLQEGIKEGVKQQIIEAAQARFARYGFAKTTMAEIAKDCRMSAANLYRYFENKEDIVVEIGNQCLHDKAAILREVLKQPGLTAPQRFEAFVLAALRYTHNLFSAQPHLSELVEFLCRERADAAACHMETYRDLLAEVLEEGNRTGEFRVADPVAAASAIQVATLKFSYPPVMMQEGLSLEELESQARTLVALMVGGLSKR